MTITYKLLLDKRFYRVAVNRYYKQRSILRKLPLQFLFVLMVSFFMWIYAWKGHAEWSKTAGWGFLLLVVLSVLWFFFSRWTILHRFKRRKDFNSEVTVSLSDDGISVTGRHAKSELQWAAYPEAVRFTDGILLLRKGVIRWLPDAAIQEGTPQDATALVQSKTELRRKGAY